MSNPSRISLRRAGFWDIRSCASKIELVCDGAGPMGWYDLIYVYDYNGRTLAVMPAHYVLEWEPIFESKPKSNLEREADI